ncbi:hypothetical protein [Gracilibacillus boraciitolerans]|nr:hypothetical protein [Gracilibacillus boraciitolerans]
MQRENINLACEEEERGTTFKKMSHHNGEFGTGGQIGYRMK